MHHSDELLPSSSSDDEGDGACETEVTVTFMETSGSLLQSYDNEGECEDEVEEEDDDDAAILQVLLVFTQINPNQSELNRSAAASC